MPIEISHNHFRVAIDNCSFCWFFTDALWSSYEQMGVRVPIPSGEIPSPLKKWIG